MHLEGPEGVTKNTRRAVQQRASAIQKAEAAGQKIKQIPPVVI
jgi:hypothetical protein